MTKFKIERQNDNSTYESHFTMEWRKDVQMLVVTLGDNNTVDTIMVFDHDEAKALKAYLEGEL